MKEPVLFSIELTRKSGSRNPRKVSVTFDGADYVARLYNRVGSKWVCHEPASYFTDTLEDATGTAFAMFNR